nr:hypothetical protein [Tanacetum cinerariifolium]
MTTMAENVIAAGADNRPRMLEKSRKNFWQRRMLLYIREDGIIRAITYEELTDEEKIHEQCDTRATNIFLQGYHQMCIILFNHHTVAKEIKDKVKLLIEGTELSLQERECKLYNEFDRFTSKKGETIHAYYLRFAQLINDMNTIGMTMQKL